MYKAADRQVRDSRRADSTASFGRLGFTPPDDNILSAFNHPLRSRPSDGHPNTPQRSPCHCRRAGCSSPRTTSTWPSLALAKYSSTRPPQIHWVPSSLRNCVLESVRNEAAQECDHVEKAGLAAAIWPDKHLHWGQRAGYVAQASVIDCLNPCNHIPLIIETTISFSSKRSEQCSSKPMPRITLPKGLRVTSSRCGTDAWRRASKSPARR